MHDMIKFLTAILQSVDDSKSFNDEGRASLRAHTHYHIERIRISSSMDARIQSLVLFDHHSKRIVCFFMMMDRGYRCRSYICTLSMKDIERSLKIGNLLQIEINCF